MRWSLNASYSQVTKRHWPHINVSAISGNCYILFVNGSFDWIIISKNRNLNTVTFSKTLKASKLFNLINFSFLNKKNDASYSKIILKIKNILRTGSGEIVVGGLVVHGGNAIESIELSNFVEFVFDRFRRTRLLPITIGTIVCTAFATAENGKVFAENWISEKNENKIGFFEKKNSWKRIQLLYIFER